MAIAAGVAAVLVSGAAILPAYANTSKAVRGGDEGEVLIGASDIASCYSLDGAEATAALLEDVPGTIFTAGDNSQDSGAPDQYRDCFGPTWGQYKDRIRPVPGNHDYMSSGASGYYNYFGAAAGPSGKGYYSYDLGSWHIVALNSNCYDIGGCGEGSAEEKWLRADLASNTKSCTAAYWHHPLFTSSMHTSQSEVQALFQALYDYGAEVVMNGHNHVYERFAPQNPSGELDKEYGIREFTVGTGGTSHYSFNYMTEPNSEARNNDTYGVLKLTLKDGSYDWKFLPTWGGRFTDSGSGTCHDAPDVDPGPTGPGWPPVWPPTKTATPSPTSQTTNPGWPPVWPPTKTATPSPTSQTTNPGWPPVWPPTKTPTPSPTTGPTLIWPPIWP